MIPAFPNFKKIEVSDRPEVEGFSHRYPPYSDFNFTSLWAWDTSGERMLSVLNDNLVVRFTDYSTEEPFFSFLGANLQEQTARELIRFATASGISAVLRLVPESSAAGIRTSFLAVTEDRNHFDYIYSTAELSDMHLARFKSRRKSAAGFLRDFPNARLEIRDMGDTETQKNVIEILRAWEKNKVSGNKVYELKHEEAAILRLFETAASQKLIVAALFDGDAMCAFTIEELLPSQYCLGHFWKADTAYSGAYDALTQKMAQHLLTRDIALWNWEQDLGVDSLRKSKMSYRPVNFLKKYTVMTTGSSATHDD